ncbi:MAG: MurT ligase domain-containing protein [Patescibacteria group bacterium]
MTFFLIALGKLVLLISKTFNLGSGSTWPGHIALESDKNFIKKLLSRNKELKIILVAGTNGKTTTGKLIQTILEKNDRKVFQNEGGANLLNGLASSLINQSDLTGKINYDFAVFEVDENSLPIVLRNLNPQIIVLLNLFRDQLDRYGEVDIVADKWKKAINTVDKSTTLILNVDDPKIALLGKNIKNTKYFGVTGSNSDREHASDSTYCPKCGNRLYYKNTTFSHLGDWLCDKCGLKRPKLDLEKFQMYPLPGLYNKYNTNAAVLTAKILGISDNISIEALRNFKPAFGRQEIIEYENKKIQIFLSKNPASFNQSLETINDLKAKNLLIILNDRIPDGRDVSWIWDVDFENNLGNFKNIAVSGDRAYDMALRLKYADRNDVKAYEVLSDAIDESVDSTPNTEKLYILPTYSAMLDLRKILIGRKIL